jgi:hypothetical protein
VDIDMARGLKNNNPLNIRRNNTKWQGLAPVQSDKAFFVFVAPEWGYRAALRTLQNYNRVHGLTSIRQWISRWAPPVENDTEAYIRLVCQKTGMPESAEPNINNKTIMCNIVAAMSLMENGKAAVMEDVYKGWELL